MTVRPDASAMPNSLREHPAVSLMCASHIRPESIQWLWPGWLARGKITILAGAAGTSKTTIAMHVAACVSSVSALPCGHKPLCGNVLIWTGEDGIADTLVPRLIAAGADMRGVHFVGPVSSGRGVHPFDPSEHMPLLTASAQQLGEVALVIIDPIVSAVSGDSHKSADVRRSLQPVVDMAQKLNSSVLGITHFSKGTGGKNPTERVTGSLAFGALARIVAVTSHIKGAKGECDHVLALAKSNIGPSHGGYKYGLAQKDLSGGVVANSMIWGDRLEGSAQDLLDQAESECVVGQTGIEAFLRRLLAEGDMAAKEVIFEAEATGYNVDQLNRAKRRIGVKSTKSGMAGEWRWSLPAGS